MELSLIGYNYNHQLARSSDADTVLTLVLDADVAYYRAYCARNALCNGGNILCDFCLRCKKEDTEIKSEEEKVNSHHTRSHKNKKLNFSCDVCKLKFANRGDAGLHQYYVHSKPNGWWNEAVARQD